MKGTKAIVAALFFLCLSLGIHPQNMDSKAGSIIQIHHLKKDFPVSELKNRLWKKGSVVSITNYWSGEKAPGVRRVSATLLWSDTGLYVRFEANQKEPLIVSSQPDLTKKTKGLWDRDVCEIFIAPNKSERNKYFEFEIAPTGEWIDLGIEVTPEQRMTDWEYASGMRSAAKVEKDKVVMAIKIDWRALGTKPNPHDTWLGNLFRCVGKDPTRGYLSWQATNTKEPSFHVPSKFGEFEFVK